MRGARCAARKDTEAGTCRWSCRQRWTGAAAASAAAAPCPGQILPADLTTAHVQAMFTAISRQHEAMGRPVTDLGSGTAFISWQLRQYDGHVVLCPPKTARSERVIAVDRTTVAALPEHRSRQLAERAAAGEDYLGSG